MNSSKVEYHQGSSKVKFYFPGHYLNNIKRPRQSALQRLLKDDLIPWVLSGISSNFSISVLVGLICLFFSMWSFYEIGYYDNDCCALKYESDGKVTEEARQGLDHSYSLQAAVIGALLGCLGAFLIAQDSWLLTMGIWLGTMAMLWFTYLWYNRIDKNSRTWLYLILQMFRSGSLFLVVPASSVALAVAGSQMIARWLDYIIYRYVRKLGISSKFPKTHQKTVRLMLAILFLLPMILQRRWDEFVVPASLCIFYYLFIAARREFTEIFQQYCRLDKNSR